MIHRDIDYRRMFGVKNHFYLCVNVCRHVCGSVVKSTVREFEEMIVERMEERSALVPFLRDILNFKIAQTATRGGNEERLCYNYD